MKHWKRTLVPSGFEWVNLHNGTKLLVQVQGQRWTAVLSVYTDAEEARSRFFAEDMFDASLQKCLLYAWRALRPLERATFDLQEAYADLRRFVA